MADHDSFAGVVAGLETGDPAAAEAVFQRFTHRLIALARAKLDARLRQKLDPEDVLQSVYRSFFTRSANGEFAFDGWGGLWAMLALMTVRKCARAAERYGTAGRDVLAEMGLATDSHAGPALAARDPTPDEVAMVSELVERLMAGLSERDRQVVSLALQGGTPADIVKETGVPERTVYRVLDRVKGRISRGE